MGDIEVVHQDGIAFLADESYCWISEYRGDVMSDAGDLSPFDQL